MNSKVEFAFDPATLRPRPTSKQIEEINQVIDTLLPLFENKSTPSILAGLWAILCDRKDVDPDSIQSFGHDLCRHAWEMMRRSET